MELSIQTFRKSERLYLAEAHFLDYSLMPDVPLHYDKSPFHVSVLFNRRGIGERE